MADVNKTCSGNYDEKLKSLIADADALARGLRDLKRSKREYISGWCVTKGGEFYKLTSRVRGKVASIHIGKTLDRALAAEKIKNWELLNGITPSESDGQ